MQKNNTDRAEWGSNLGFLLAAVGSAVGLGNIWGFPYKLGKSGGFAFLVVYMILVMTVGVVIMAAELSLGRRTGKGVVGAFASLGKKYTIIGWMGYAAPLLIMGFYSVLAGYCLKYAIGNFQAMFGAPIADSGAFFSGMLQNQGESVLYTLICLGLTLLIVIGGIDKGIERFSKIAMPALFVMMVVVIIRSVTLEGASEGLKFMFVPNPDVLKENSMLGLLSTAGGQMFFSLSLGMGTMVTYGSYLPKKENIVKNAVFISLADTAVAIMAGLAVMPAVFATMAKTGDTSLLKSGPSLLFVSLQTVFYEMGAVGAVFGFIFYALVLIAAITSMVSLVEALCAYFIDRQEQQGKPVTRKKIACMVGAVVAVSGIIVAMDGLGSNGMWVPFHIDCWLDFFDICAENILMPTTAFLIAVSLGWCKNPHDILDEMEADGSTFRYRKAYIFCIRYIVPVVMLMVLVGMLKAIPTMIVK